MSRNRAGDVTTSSRQDQASTGRERRLTITVPPDLLGELQARADAWRAPLAQVATMLLRHAIRGDSPPWIVPPRATEGIPGMPQASAGILGMPADAQPTSTSCTLVQEGQEVSLVRHPPASRGCRDRDGWGPADVAGRSCPVDASHGSLVPRQDPRDGSWFGGCPSYRRTRCAGKYDPRHERRQAAGRDDAAQRDRIDAQPKRPALAAPEPVGATIHRLRPTGARGYAPPVVARHPALEEAPCREA